MANDRSPLWLQELQIALSQSKLERLDRAISELIQLGWTCERLVQSDGTVKHIEINIKRTLEFDLCP